MNLNRRAAIGSLFGGLFASVSQGASAQLLRAVTSSPYAPAVITAPFSKVNGVADGPVASWYHGWSGDYATTHTIPGAPETFTCLRRGYDGTGALTWHNDTISITRMVRHAVAPADVAFTNFTTTAAFSEPVLLNDIIFGASNNSTIPYPKPVATWMDVPKQLIDATGLNVEVYATGYFARWGRGVACVKITGTPTTGSPVTKTATYQLSTKYGDAIPVYSAPFSTADFVANGDGDVSFSYQAFPWCGAADGSTIATTSGSYPDVTVGSTAMVYRSQGPATIYYAYVDGVGGAPAVKTTLAAAKGTPYASITAAMTGMFTQTSDASFMHIVLKASVALTWDNTNPTGATRLAKNGWLVIEGDPTDPDPYTNVTVTTSGTNKGIFTNPGGSNLNYLCFRNMTFTVATSTNIANFGGSTGFWLDHVNFVSNVSSPTNTGTYCFITRCAGSGSGNALGTSAQMLTQLIRASTTTGALTANHIVSSTGTGCQWGLLAHLATENLIMLCTRYPITTGSTTTITPATVTNAVGGVSPGIQRNTAGVNIQVTGSGSAAPLTIDLCELSSVYIQNQLWFNMSGANSGANANLDAGRLNLISTWNGATIAPGTFGLAYDQGQFRLVAVRNCSEARLTFKYDVFCQSINTGSANLIGGHSVLHGCGLRNNQSENTAGTFRADITTYGGGAEDGYMGLNSIAAVAIVYVDRPNNNLTPVSGYRTVPFKDMVESWDINGKAFRLDGTDPAGATAL